MVSLLFLCSCTLWLWVLGYRTMRATWTCLMEQDTSTCLVLRFIYCPWSQAISRTAFVFFSCMNYYLESVSTFGSHMSALYFVVWDYTDALGLLVSEIHISCSLLTSAFSSNTFKFKYFNFLRILDFIYIISTLHHPVQLPHIYIYPYSLTNLWPLIIVTCIYTHCRYSLINPASAACMYMCLEMTI